jgi:hypothetical protein
MPDEPRERPLDVEWAVISKHPGSNADYGVLYTSGGNTDTGDLSRIAFRYVAGNPSPSLRGRDDLPLAPPWATFGTYSTDLGRSLISVTVQFPWNRESDNSNRPIWPRHFFACSFDDAGASHWSYRTLYEAVTRLELPPAQAGPARITVGAPALSEIEAAAGDNFVWRASIAAALLETDAVAITGTAQLTLEQRLTLLDSIIALLPYRLRAELPVSSSVGTGFSPGLRLFLADYPVDYGRPTIYNGAPPELLTPVAQAYYETLLRKRSTVSLGGLIEHLWYSQEECSFARPETIHRVLDKFNQVPEILALIAGPDPIDLRSALKFFDVLPKHPGAWQELRVQRRRELVGLVLDARTPDADNALVGNWKIIVADVQELGQDWLDAGDVNSAARILEFAGGSLGLEDKDGLLGAMLLPPRAGLAGPERRRTAASARVVLLRRQVMVPDPNQLRQACDVLRYGFDGWTGDLVFGLLAAELAHGTAARAGAWASWLCESQPPKEWRGPDPRWHQPAWMAALAWSVRNPADRGTDESLRTVLHETPRWAEPILTLAGASETLGEVFHALDLDLIDIARSASGFFAQWLARALTMSAATMAAGGIAIADSARIFLDSPPSNLIDNDSGPRFPDYLAGLGRVFRQLSDQPDLCDRLQVGFLYRKVLSVVQDRKRLTPGVLKLLVKWSVDHNRAGQLARYIADQGIAQQLVGYRELDVIWSPLIGHDDRLAVYAMVAQLRSAAKFAKANPAKALGPASLHRSEDGTYSETKSGLVGAIYDALFKKMPEAGILEIIGSEWHDPAVQNDSARTTPPLTANQFFSVLQQSLSLLNNYPPPGPAPSDDDIQKIMDEFTGCIIFEDAFGPDFGQQYSARVVRDSLGDRIKRYQAMIWKFTGFRARRRWRKAHPRPERRREPQPASPPSAQPRAIAQGPKPPPSNDGVAGGDAGTTNPRLLPSPTTARAAGQPPGKHAAQSDELQVRSYRWRPWHRPPAGVTQGIAVDGKGDGEGDEPR